MERDLLCKDRPEVTVYTDAQVGRQGTGRIGFGCHVREPCGQSSCARCEVTGNEVGLPDGARFLIDGAETAAAAFVLDLRGSLAGTRATLRVDNPTCHSVLVNGSSSTEELNRLAILFWGTMTEVNCEITIELVLGMDSLADAPPRRHNVGGAEQLPMGNTNCTHRYEAHVGSGVMPEARRKRARGTQTLDTPRGTSRSAQTQAKSSNPRNGDRPPTSFIRIREFLGIYPAGFEPKHHTGTHARCALVVRGFPISGIGGCAPAFPRGPTKTAVRHRPSRSCPQAP
jgi:hypothetical protein